MKRRANKKFYEDVRQRDGVCLVGCIRKDGCNGPLEVHHIIKRSQGGADEVGNGILMCQRHHQMVHHADISAEELVAMRDRFKLPTSEAIRTLFPKKKDMFSTASMTKKAIDEYLNSDIKSPIGHLDSELVKASRNSCGVIADSAYGIRGFIK